MSRSQRTYLHSDFRPGGRRGRSYGRHTWHVPAGAPVGYRLAAAFVTVGLGAVALARAMQPASKAS